MGLTILLYGFWVFLVGAGIALLGNRPVLFRTLAIISSILLSIYCILPPAEKIPLGLDLRGGVHIEAQIDWEELQQRLEKESLSRDEKEQYLQQALTVTRNRINQRGTEEAEIRKGGSDRIVLQIPGYADIESAEALLTKVGYLEFAMVNEDPDQLNQALAGRTILGHRLLTMKRGEVKGEERSILVKDRPELDGSYIDSAGIGQDDLFRFQVNISFNNRGAKLFANVTQKNVGKQMAIILDDMVYSAPVIRQEIFGGQAQITGDFNQEEALELAAILNAGALPAKIEVIQSRLISASLGKDSINQGSQAAIYGLILVAIFMMIYYRLAGLIAVFALFLNVLLILGAVGGLHITLTLPGIAGLILTMGMAVDANVLIFERIREELKLGKRVKTALKAGYDRAFRTILDANVTTGITSFILYQYGTGPIKGFAIVLLTGIVISMFTSLFVTRTLFNLILAWKGDLETLNMMQFLRPTAIPFIHKRRLAYGFSLVMLAAGLAGFLGKGESKYGIDFRGGSVLELEFGRLVAIEDLRGLFSSNGIDAAIQYFGGEKHVLVRARPGETQKILETLKASDFKEFQVERMEDVGPVVGKELKQTSLVALLLSLIGIIIYIAVRFEFRFSVASVVALIHDILITTGIYCLLGYEMNLPTVAALLTIVGYSLNDTIVIFDRIREALGVPSRKTEAELVNEAINQTLNRTLLTSLTTLLVVGSILIYGGGIIHDFAVTLFIGILVGTYSSIFVAAPILVELEHKGKKSKPA